MFLEREDRALKLKFRDELTVTDMASTVANEPRKVDVWFRYPDKEVRDVSYPFLTIDFVGLQKASEREHRNVIPLDYVPEEYQVVNETAATGIKTDFPVPYEIYYAITTYTRDPRHDRQLLAQLIQFSSRLSFRFGWLEVPEDKTLRRLDVLGMDVQDYKDGEGKTVFRKVFTITVSAELFPDDVTEARIADRVAVNLEHTTMDLILEQNEDVTV